MNHGGCSAGVLKAQSGSYHSQLELLDSEQQMINQSQSYTDGRHAVPNIILTGEGLNSLIVCVGE